MPVARHARLLWSLFGVAQTTTRRSCLGVSRHNSLHDIRDLIDNLADISGRRTLLSGVVPSEQQQAAARA